jgi:chromatin assembly factor 1 subunit A
VQKQQQEEAATKKSAAAFAKFFNKKQPPKTEILTANGRKGVSSEGVSARSDYERTFHPFVLKKHVVMAPPNWFTLKKKDVIVIDFDEGQGQASTSARGNSLNSLCKGV